MPVSGITCAGTPGSRRALSRAPQRFTSARRILPPGPAGTAPRSTPAATASPAHQRRDDAGPPEPAAAGAATAGRSRSVDDVRGDDAAARARCRAVASRRRRAPGPPAGRWARRTGGPFALAASARRAQRRPPSSGSLRRCRGAAGAAADVAGTASPSASSQPTKAPGGSVRTLRHRGMEQALAPRPRRRRRPCRWPSRMTDVADLDQRRRRLTSHSSISPLSIVSPSFGSRTSIATVRLPSARAAGGSPSAMRCAVRDVRLLERRG